MCARAVMMAAKVRQDRPLRSARRANSDFGQTTTESGWDHLKPLRPAARRRPRSSNPPLTATRQQPATVEGHAGAGGSRSVGAGGARQVPRTPRSRRGDPGTSAPCPRGPLWLPSGGAGRPGGPEASRDRIPWWASADRRVSRAPGITTLPPRRLASRYSIVSVAEVSVEGIPPTGPPAPDPPGTCHHRRFSDV